MGRALKKKRSNLRKGVRWSANTWGTKLVNYHIIGKGEIKYEIR